MRKFYIHLIFLLMLFLTSCFEKQEQDIESAKETRPYLKGTKKVNLKVDEAYDLGNTVVHSIADSIPMNGSSEKSLYVPEEFVSAVFFLDESSGEILAVVRTDTVRDNITVNAESVAEALLDMVPSYYALSFEQQKEFKGKALTVEPYKQFVNIVDGNLKGKKPIYSTDYEFINQVLALNSYFLTNYLENSKKERARVADGGIRIIPDFPGWLINKNGGEIQNWAWSYVYAEFNPMNGDKPYSTILDPLPFDIEDAEQIPLSSLKLKDDCYTVRFNQTHLSAKEKNQLAIATNVTSMFLGIVFGAIGDKSKNDCTANIARSIISDISTTIMGAANKSSLEDLTSATLETSKNAILAAYSSKACRTFAINRGVIATILATKLIYFQAVIAAAGTAYTLVEIAPYILALIDPIELTEIIQLHDTKLIEACVKVEKDGILNEEYASGEIIHPGIKLEAQSHYAEWQKSGFNVNWKLLPGNGNINIPSSKTSNEGKAYVSWTLPDDISEATLIAEIKDKEGDHLEGSPLEFFTKLTDCDPSNPNIPLITGVSLSCGGSGIYIDVSFTAEGPGILPYGDSRACDPTLLCYPVRLYFFSPGADDWHIAANGYSASLLSGTVNDGVIRINFYHFFGNCFPGMTPREFLEAGYTNYKWQVQLINKCNERSATYTL